MAINHVSMSGNLTRNAELTRTPGDLPVLNFSIAINERKKSPETGDYIDAPVFVRCTIFGDRAERLAPHLLKGTKVMVDGRLHYSSYMKDDERRSALSVIVSQVEFSSKGSRKPSGEVD